MLSLETDPILLVVEKIRTVNCMCAAVQTSPIRDTLNFVIRGLRSLDKWGWREVEDMDQCISVCSKHLMSSLSTFETKIRLCCMKG